MFRRIVLALTFAAAFGGAGVGMTSEAKAHGGCGYGNYYNNYYGGLATYNGYRGVYYGGYPTYGPSYFATGYTYVPPVVFFPKNSACGPFRTSTRWISNWGRLISRPRLIGRPSITNETD